MEIYCWPLPDLTGISKEYWVLQRGTEGVNLLKSIKPVIGDDFMSF
jgi:hypothetical protein